MLMGHEFYETAFSIQGPNIKSNAFQSNLTLIDDDFISIIKKYRVGIGVSIDGVKEIHDHNRDNSFDRVFAAIHTLHSSGIRVGAISTITPESLPYLFENFALFQKLSLNMRFNPRVTCAGNKHALMIDSKIYEFAIRFYHDLWLGTNRKLRMYPSSEVIDFLTGKRDYGCLFGNNCAGHSNAVLANGDVFICGRAAGITGYVGNVHDENFSFGFENPLILKYNQENENRIQTNCSSCEYFRMCMGGCRNNTTVTDDGSEAFCGAYKGIFRHILIRKQQMGG